MPPLKFLPVFYLTLILLGTLFITNAEARQSFSSRAGEVDRVLISIPDPDSYDVCGYIWEKYAPLSIKGEKKNFPKSLTDKVPKRFRALVETVSFKPEKLFKKQCNSYKAQLVDSIKEPFVSAQKQRDKAHKAYLDIPRRVLINSLIELRKSFYSWVAFTARDYILPSLPAKEQAKFQPDSAYAQEKAYAWLNEPNREIDAYVKAYLKEHHQLLSTAYLKYLDWTGGQSREILEGFAVILSDAEKKLQRIGKLQAELAEPVKRKTPYAKMLKDSGFSGDWLDNFKAYEEDFNVLDKQYNIVVATRIIVDSFQTEDPSAKIDAMFELLDNLSATAANSHLPIVSLFGGIIQAYAQVGKQMLGAVNDLGAALRKRSGYCIGTGVPIGRKGIDRYAEAKQYAVQFKASQQELICPLAFDRYPMKHVYEAVEQPSGRLFFWDGKKFIVGKKDGGGLAGVQKSFKILSAARSLNYRVAKEEHAGVKLLAHIYNTPFPGGIPGLLEEAQEVMSGIAGLVQKLEETIDESDQQCSQQDFRNYLQNFAGLDVGAFNKELSTQGLGRLVTTYAATYIAKEGGFGKKNTARGNAYGRYEKIREKTETLNFLEVIGRVVDEQNTDASCPECGNAELEIHMKGGLQVPGCEVTQTDAQGQFIIQAISLKPVFEITIQAKVQNSSSDRYRLTEKDFERWDEISVDLPILLSKEKSASGNKNKSQSNGARLFVLRTKMENLATTASSLQGQGRQLKTDLQGLLSELSKGFVNLNKNLQSLNQGLFKVFNSADTPQGGNKLNQYLSNIKVGGEELAALRNSIERATLGLCRSYEKIKTSSRLEEIKQLYREAENGYRAVKADYKQSEETKYTISQLMRQSQQMEQVSSQNPAVNQTLITLLNQLKVLERNFTALSELQKLAADLRFQTDGLQGAMADTMDKVGAIMVQADQLRGMAADQNDEKQLQSLAEFYRQAGRSQEHLFATVNALTELEDKSQLLVDETVQPLDKARTRAALLGDMYGVDSQREVVALAAEIRATVEAANLFKEPIATARKNAAICFDGIKGQYRQKGSAQNQLAEADCLQFPGTTPQWDEAEQEVFCNCPEGIDWDDEQGKCIDNTPAGQVARTDCSKSPGTVARWNEQKLTASCYCPEGLEWSKQDGACLDNSPAGEISRLDCSAWPGTIAKWNDSLNRAQCFCPDGWKWDKKNQSCYDNSPAAQVARLDCSSYPGTSAKWSQKTNSAKCFCPDGLQWDKHQSQCIDNSRQARLARASCSDYGRYAEKYWDSAKGRVQCRCIDGYHFDSNGSCIKTRLTTRNNQAQWEKEQRLQQARENAERQKYCQEALGELRNAVRGNAEAGQISMHIASAYSWDCDPSDIEAAKRGNGGDLGGGSSGQTTQVDSCAGASSYGPSRRGEMQCPQNIGSDIELYDNTWGSNSGVPNTYFLTCRYRECGRRISSGLRKGKCGGKHVTIKIGYKTRNTRDPGYKKRMLPADYYMSQKNDVRGTFIYNYLDDNIISEKGDAFWTNATRRIIRQAEPYAASYCYDQ